MLLRVVSPHYVGSDPRSRPGACPTRNTEREGCSREREQEGSRVKCSLWHYHSSLTILGMYCQRVTSCRAPAFSPSSCAQAAARSPSSSTRGPFVPFTKKLSGGKSSEALFSRSCLAMLLAAEPVIQRDRWKRVSKQATARPFSDPAGRCSSKDCMASVGLHPWVGHPTTSKSTPCSSTACI